MLIELLTAQNPLEMQHRDGRIHHLTLLVLIVMQGFQHIITQAKKDHNLGVRGFFLLMDPPP
jgi:hypothetical protein